MEIVSACLVGIKCRYDASACINENLKKLYDEGKLAAICPECDAGLLTPRSPMEIIGGDGSDVLKGRARVMSKDGKDFTQQFLIGAKKALETAKKHGASYAYLKSKSPSCGNKIIYDGSFCCKLKKGDGVTAALLKKNNIILIEV